MSWEKSQRRSQLPKNWESLRRQVLDAEPLCRHCRTAPATDVDHIKRGQDHSLENLQPLCAPCHLRKTQAEAVQARRPFSELPPDSQSRILAGLEKARHVQKKTRQRQKSLTEQRTKDRQRSLIESYRKRKRNEK